MWSKIVDYIGILLMAILAVLSLGFFSMMREMTNIARLLAIIARKMKGEPNDKK